MKRFLSLMMALAMLTSLAMADEATPTDVTEASPAPETVPETVEELAETKQPAEPVTTETPAEPETAAPVFAAGYVAIPAGTRLFADEAMTVLYGVLAEDAVGYRAAEHAVWLSFDGEAVLVYTVKGEPSEAPAGEADATVEGFGLVNAVLAADELPQPAEPKSEEPKATAEPTMQPEATAEPDEQPQATAEPEKPVEEAAQPEDSEPQPEEEAAPAEPFREDWQAAPAVTAEQTGEGEVTFTITPTAEAEKYSIYEVLPDGEAAFVRNVSTVVYTLKDVAAGEHLYKVQARKTINGATVKGDWCEPVGVTVGPWEQPMEEPPVEETAPAEETAQPEEAPISEEAPEDAKPDDGIRAENGSFILATADYEITFTPCEGGVGATKYTQIRAARTVTIPAEVRGNPVLYIGEGFMDGNAEVESVILPPTVQELRDAAFRNCVNLLFGN